MVAFFVSWLEIDATWQTFVLSVGVVVLFLLAVMRFFSRPRETKREFERAEGNKRLVVYVPGQTGRARSESAVTLCREALLNSDLLVFDYDSKPFSNVDPYGVTNFIEKEIHDTYLKHRYDEIVVVGHSMGGMFLRKAIIWANGIEQDRGNYGAKGAREWVEASTGSRLELDATTKVFLENHEVVALAGSHLSRGWSYARAKQLGERLSAICRSSTP